MYSLVLMTAMTTAPDAPEFNGFFRDLFSGNCAGCYGTNLAPRYNCYGGCGGSYYPAGCSGAFYNGCNGCYGDTFMNRVRRWFDRGNCCGTSGSGYGFACGVPPAYSMFGSAGSYASAVLPVRNPHCSVGGCRAQAGRSPPPPPRPLAPTPVSRQPPSRRLPAPRRPRRRFPTPR